MRRLETCFAFLLLLAGGVGPARATVATPSRADASPSASGPGARLDAAWSLRRQGRFAAMESLATAVRLELEAQPHPDTLQLADAWYVVHWSRDLRFLVGDDTGRDAGLRSLALYAALRVPPDTLVFRGHRELGWTLNRQNRLNESAAHYRKALDLARRHAEWGEVPLSVILFNLAESFGGLGAPDSAVAYYRESLEGRRRLNLPHDSFLGEVGARIGEMLEQLGDDDAADAAYGQAVQSDVTRLGPQDPALAGPLSRRAAFEFRRGNYAGALDNYRRAVDVLTPRVGPDDLNRVLMLGGVAQSLEELGDLAHSQAVYRQILPPLERRLGPRNPQPLGIRLSLGSVRQRLGDNRGALAEFDTLRTRFAADTTGMNRDPLGAALAGSAMAWLALDRPAEALRCASAAESIYATTATGNEGAVLQSLCWQMQAKARLGDWAGVDSVDARLTRRLARGSAGQSRADDVWTTRAEMARRRGRPTEAARAAARGARDARERLVRNVRALSDRQGLQLAAVLSRPLDELLLDTAGGDSALVGQAWDEVVRTRGLVRAEMARRRVPPDAAADSTRRTAYAAWVNAGRRLARYEVRAAGTAGAAGDDSTLVALRAAVDEGERRLVMAYPAAQAAAAPAPGLFEVRQRILPDQALVSFVQAPGAAGARGLRAYLVRGGAAAPVALELGSVATLAPLVARWREELGNPDPARRSEAACRAAGARVRARVWDPIARALPGAREIFLVPEAPLLGLPWAALPLGARGYLVETGPLLHVLEAERDLLPDASAPAGRGLLALGGLDYDHSAPAASDSGARRPAVTPVAAPTAGLRGATPCDSLALRGLPPLPGTAAELRDIAALWRAGGGATAGGADALLLEDSLGTEAAFKARAPGVRVLHLATHGIALDESCGAFGATLRGVGGVAPLGGGAGVPAPAAGRRRVARPAAAAPDPDTGTNGPASPWLGRQVLLALAGANRHGEHVQDEDEGLLTAEEVTTLDLRGVEWVVLSACHSGAGPAWAREGVLGMQRAFRLAGARTVIASQWSVEDEATREWMHALYAGRAAGAVGAAEALAAADRAVLRARRAAGASTHPFYWAAFTATGE